MKISNSIRRRAGEPPIYPGLNIYARRWCANPASYNDQPSGTTTKVLVQKSRPCMEQVPSACCAQSNDHFAISLSLCFLLTVCLYLLQNSDFLGLTDIVRKNVKIRFITRYDGYPQYEIHQEYSHRNRHVSIQSYIVITCSQWRYVIVNRREEA